MKIILGGHISMKISELFKPTRVLEAAVNSRPTYTEIESEERAIEIIYSRSGDALWMLKNDAMLYRGVDDMELQNLKYCAYVDSSKTERRSQNTSNHYTAIFDNHPEMTNFPKRSRSFIGSTSQSTALMGYADGHIDFLFVMIPFDDAKIGVAPKADIWHLMVDAFGMNTYLENINYKFSMLHGDDISDFYNFDENLRAVCRSKRGLNHEDEWDGDDADWASALRGYDRFKSIFPDGDCMKYMDTINDAYSPRKTGLQWYYPKDLPKNLKNNEVWVSGKMLMVPYQKAHFLIKEL
jgi:hypothetical protein